MSRLMMMVCRSRAACGRAALFAKNGQTLFGPIRVLATASRFVAKKQGNPTCDALRPFGHPPAGTYLLAGSLPPGFAPRPRRAHRFGRAGALILTPERGDARAAATNGRRLFYVHGGPPDRRGRLRPTLGGFRLADEDMVSLLRAINAANAAGDPLSEVELVETPDGALASTPARDRPGKLRPWLGPRARAPRAPSPARAAPRAGRVSLSGAALFTLGARFARGSADRRDAAADPARRDFLALALLFASGAVTGCGGDDQPSPPSCERVACDPVDSWCPPSGYVCADDVVSGGGGGDIVAGGGVLPPPEGDDNSGDPNSSDDSGGAG